MKAGRWRQSNTVLVKTERWVLRGIRSTVMRRWRIWRWCSHLKGRVLVITEYRIGRTIKPWMKRPRMTVVKYQPNCISTFPKSPIPSTWWGNSQLFGRFLIDFHLPADQEENSNWSQVDDPSSDHLTLLSSLYRKCHCVPSLRQRARWRSWGEACPSRQAWQGQRQGWSQRRPSQGCLTRSTTLLKYCKCFWRIFTETISQTLLKDHALKESVGTFEGPGGEVCRVPERFPSLVLETPCRVDQGGPVLLHRRLENVIFRLREISSSFGCLVCQRVWCKQLPALSGGNSCPVSDRLSVVCQDVFCVYNVFHTYGVWSVRVCRVKSLFGL